MDTFEQRGPTSGVLVAGARERHLLSARYRSTQPVMPAQNGREVTRSAAVFQSERTRRTRAPCGTTHARTGRNSMRQVACASPKEVVVPSERTTQ